MCGITGFWHLNNAAPNNLIEIAERMNQQLIRRGPDASGVWQEERTPLVLAHRRLAIRDLSEHGTQPMLSQSKRYVLVYNGEIYNTVEIKKILNSKSIYLRGHSDTEVLVEALALWGVEKTLQKINGMFAFALWDRQEKKLTLARDRLGIKPLYFGLNNGIFFFASELKALLQHPNFKSEIDREALISYFRFNYFPTPLTIYQGIKKMVPGQYIEITEQAKILFKTYWSVLDIKESKLNNLNAEAKLHDLLKDAVKKRFVADVPLGAFLSGGIDSSLVVALMQAQSQSRVKTFSIGFEEQGFNEAKYAKQVAAHLGTDHHELYLSGCQAMELIPTLPDIYDEPFADSSQIPTLLVAKFAKKSVTVCLSGDGGDELFAGYSRYLFANLWQARFRAWPEPIKKLMARCLLAIRSGHWDQLAKLLPSKFRPSLLGNKAHKVAGLLQGSTQGFYKQLVSLWDDPAQLVPGYQESFQYPKLVTTDFVRNMQLLDILFYLPSDILTKIDRASMACSLETRVPLLDYRVVEYAFSLQSQLKFSGLTGKLIMRRILSNYLPTRLIDRPKMGFGVPLAAWLRGPLQEWAQELLTTAKLESFGLNSKLIRTRWESHQKSVNDWQYSLWGVLMLLAWHENLAKQQNAVIERVQYV